MILGFLFAMWMTVVTFFRKPLQRAVTSAIVGLLQALVYLRALHSLHADGRGWMFAILLLATVSAIAMYRKVLA